MRKTTHQRGGIAIKALSRSAGRPAGLFEDVFFEALDGTRLHAWWLPAPNARRALIVSHGNAGNMSHRAQAGEFFRDEFGINVLTYDYRGYGRSEGAPSEQGTYSDIRAAYEHVRSGGFQPESIFLMGQSLGSAVTVELAANEKRVALPSVAAVAQSCRWGFSGRSMTRFRRSGGYRRR